MQQDSLQSRMKSREWVCWWLTRKWKKTINNREEEDWCLDNDDMISSNYTIRELLGYELPLKQSDRSRELWGIRSCMSTKKNWPLLNWLSRVSSACMCARKGSHRVRQKQWTDSSWIVSWKMGKSRKKGWDILKITDWIRCYAQSQCISVKMVEGMGEDLKGERIKLSM